MFAGGWGFTWFLGLLLVACWEMGGDGMGDGMIIIRRKN